MILPLVKTTLRQKRVAILSYSLGGLAAIWLYVSIYPSMAAQIGSYNDLTKSLPPTLLKAFGADNIGLTNFAGLIGTKQFGLLWPLLLIFFVVSFAGNTIAGEIEKTTIGLWLSQPVSRAKIFWSKYIAGIIALAVFLIFSVLAVLPITGLYKVEVSSRDIWLLCFVGGMFGLAVYGLSLFVAALFSEKSKVYGVVSGVLVLMYILNIVAGLNDKLVNLKYASFFYYYNVSEILTGGSPLGWGIVIFLTTAVLGAVVAALIFKHRDISV